MASSEKKPVRVALLGCGTVGGGVLRLLQDNRESLPLRVGAPLEVAHVLVRDASKTRVPECRAEWMTTDPDVVLGDDSVDVVVEVMGGEQPARSYIERAIDAGKSVVSANKYLLAMQGPALLARASRRGVDLAFEASVGGGIPVIRTLREALTGDSVESVHAILNGTCNYILTRMRKAGLPFDEALGEAQKLGYAEADPTLDIEGIDAAQKLVVTSMLAFGASVPVDAISVEGITRIDSLDFAAAERFGFTIKHLAVGRDLGHALSLHVHPALVARSSVMANIDDVLNCVFIRGRGLGPCLLVGRGAGDMPTAVSVVSDIVDVARSRLEGEGGMATRAIHAVERPLHPPEELNCRYYLRFDVDDTPGVLGVIASALGTRGVSIEQMVQEGRAPGHDVAVSVLMITHETREGALLEAFDAIGRETFLRARPRFIRIEDV